jgi:hypothetical protein
VRLGVGLGDVGIDEPACDRLVVEPRDEIHEILLRRQVVPKVLEARRRRIRIGRGAHGDHGFEVRVSSCSSNREPSGRGSMHEMSS